MAQEGKIAVVAGGTAGVGRAVLSRLIDDGYAVGDVKYKRSSEGRGENADCYQLLSYAAAANLPGGMLIYAAGEAEPGVHRVRYVGKRLEVVALDLSVEPSRVLAQIRSLASRVMDMADRA